MEKVFVYGGGGKGKELIEVLKANKDIEIIGVIDRDEKKHGMLIKGIKCINLQEAIEMGAKSCTVYVALNNGDEVYEMLQGQGFSDVRYVDRWIKQRSVHMMPLFCEKSDYNMVTPFNHYESPYPDLHKIKKNKSRIYDNYNIYDIDFNIGRQLDIIEMMKEIQAPVWEGKKKSNCRYFYNNDWFGSGSAKALFYFMTIFKPEKIIEVGSGYSTAAMLDVNELYFNGNIDIVSIEPNPERLYRMIKKEDKITIYESALQDIPIEIFGSLNENDILFIDSSHVSKMDSDVNRIFFEILPKLKKGVYIHFHDIFYPFVYPMEWLEQGRAYNEMYILRAFLMNNNQYSIQFFGEMLEKEGKVKLEKNLKGCGASSLWIRKE